MVKLTDENIMPVEKKDQESMDALFLYATEGIVVVDDKGEILRINPSAEKLFGYEKKEVVGKKVEILLPTRYLKMHTEHRQNFNHNPHARSMGLGLDLFGRKKDGTEFPLEISLSPYSTPSGKFIFAFIVDISLRKMAEEKLKNYSSELEKQVKNRTLILEEAIVELKKIKKELNDSLEKERELNELKSRFVSMASHEFRTPLATILSSLSLVTKYGELNEKEKQNKHIARIKTSVADLTDILNDFLSVSKLEEGKMECKPEHFNLPEYITEIVSNLQPLTKKDQKINYNHSGKREVFLDKNFLKNILFNLVSNAQKFSLEGKPINILTWFSGSELMLEVEDHGIGISIEDQKHLFQRFFRGNNVSHIQGTGLGLNIVAKYVELMNGSIEFESIEGKGTTFTIKFTQ
jgi:PAS domain S-box-containing protein